MTTDIKGLVARLREGRSTETALRWAVSPIHIEAAVTIDTQSARIAALEAELDEARVENMRLQNEFDNTDEMLQAVRAERDEARQAPWPEWADEIRKCLEGYGVDPGDEWDLPAQFEDWLAGAVEDETARATAAEAERDRLASDLAEAVKVIEPFVFGDANIADILWGNLPDSASMNMTMPLGTYRRARAFLAARSKEPVAPTEKGTDHE